MVVDTKKENLCINQVVGRRQTTINIEGDVIIPDIKPDILSVINTSGNVFVYKKEVLDGKIRLDGSINVYIMYMPDSENSTVRALNTNLDFTEILDVDEARTGMTSFEEISIKLIECRVLNGRKINLKATLEIRTKIYSNENVDIIKEIENNDNIQLLDKVININSLVGDGNSKVFAKDNLHLDNIDSLAEILKIDFDINNKETKISYNKVLAKADLDVKILFLTEDNRINSLCGKIPVMGFVDIPNVTEENICDTSYKLKNIIVKPNSSEEHSIYVEAQIELNCSVYETKEINIIQDIYSIVDNISFSKKSINAVIGKQSKKDICIISEQISMPDLANNRIYCVDIKPNILSQNIINNNIIYEGEIILNFLYESNNTIKMDSRTTKLNFNFSMETSGINTQNNLETKIEVKQNDFIVKNGGIIDCKIHLELEANISHISSINIIDEINKELSSNPSSNYSMIIYFVKKGDSIWNIAKKFKSTTSDILKINDIDDANNIREGLQLFIPRFNCKKLA